MEQLHIFAWNVTIHGTTQSWKPYSAKIVDVQE